MNYKINPLGDRLLVKPIEEQREESALIIPDSAKEKPQRGEVLAVGTGKDGKPIEEKAGDIVLYRKGAGIDPDGSGLLLMKSGVDTIAVLVAEANS